MAEVDVAGFGGGDEAAGDVVGGAEGQLQHPRPATALGQHGLEVSFEASSRPISAILRVFHHGHEGQPYQNQASFFYTYSRFISHLAVRYPH